MTVAKRRIEPDNDSKSQENDLYIRPIPTQTCGNCGKTSPSEKEMYFPDGVIAFTECECESLIFSANGTKEFMETAQKFYEEVLCEAPTAQ